MAKANKRQAIGRGLSALLKNDENQPENERGGKVLEIPIHEIDFNPNQPRKKFNIELISELAVSIKELGLIQPIQLEKLIQINIKLLLVKEDLELPKPLD